MLINADINAVQLGLTELFENEYVLDSYHSNDRWYRLGPKGQACAIERALIQDL